MPTLQLHARLAAGIGTLATAGSLLALVLCSGAAAADAAGTESGLDQFDCVLAIGETPEESLAACDRALANPPADIEKHVAVYRARAARRYQILQAQHPQSPEAVASAFTAMLADIDAAIALKPDSRATAGDLYAFRAATLDQMGKTADADKTNDQALAFDPDNIMALRYRAARRESVGDYRGALSDNDHSAELAEKDRDDSTRAEALNAACWIRAAYLIEDLDRARTDCTTAIELDSDEKSALNRALALDSRGLVGLRQGNFGLALADYSAAAALIPDVASPLYGKAIAEARLGKAADSAADAAKAAKLDPTIVDQYRDKLRITP